MPVAASALAIEWADPWLALRVLLELVAGAGARCSADRTADHGARRTGDGCPGQCAESSSAGRARA